MAIPRCAAALAGVCVWGGGGGGIFLPMGCEEGFQTQPSVSLETPYG